MEQHNLSYLSALADDMKEGILVIGSDGIITFCNQSAADVFGSSISEIQGRYLDELMENEPDNDAFFDKLIEIIYTKNKTQSNIPFISGSKLKYLTITASLLRMSADESAEIVLIHDITDIMNLALNNKKLTLRLADFLQSFVLVMVEAIDKRSSYNANHTRSMAKYAKGYMQYCVQRGSHSQKDIRPFLLSVWLHDIGKLIIPHSVMDKHDRLGSKKDALMHRIEVAQLCEQIAALKDPAYAAEAERRIDALHCIREKIIEWNNAPFLSDETIAEIRQTADLPCRTPDGIVPLLQEDTLEALTIRTGTLTDGERAIMQSHVQHTADLLSKMAFADDVKNVPVWAGGHHEYLDGSGYPNHLSGDELPWQTRLLTIIDIYDALTAEDRPYKRPMEPEAAFNILRRMAEEGKLDTEILEDFYQSHAWQRTAINDSPYIKQ
ncbi:MAG: PAS domain-containing protein [Oscillospiraceae bacterium]|nr:PAS domain-containing protein [Oscillospiraceae bacterium]